MGYVRPLLAPLEVSLGSVFVKANCDRRRLNAFGQADLVDPEDCLVREVIGDGYGQHTDYADEHHGTAYRPDETHIPPWVAEHLDDGNEGGGDTRERLAEGR